MGAAPSYGGGVFQADSVVNFPVDLGLLAPGGVRAKIDSASFYITPTGGYSCGQISTDLYAPSPGTLVLNKNNANWNTWFASRSSLGAVVATAQYHNGYNSSCAGDAGAFPDIAECV